MKARIRIFAVTVAFGVVVAACSSSGGGGTSTSVDKTEGEGDDGGGGGSSSGSGPCKTAGKACDDCIAAASKICNEGPCKQEDLDLQNCAVMPVFGGYQCEGPAGEPTDCCTLEERLLVDCWNKRCPEMQACM